MQALQHHRDEVLAIFLLTVLGVFGDEGDRGVHAAGRDLGKGGVVERLGVFRASLQHGIDDRNSGVDRSFIGIVDRSIWRLLTTARRVSGSWMEITKSATRSTSSQSPGAIAVRL